MSERALKHLVSRLATARQEDIEAVLARLRPAQRQRIRSLMAPREAAAARPADQHAPEAGEGLSPWLKARVRAAAGEPVAPGRRPFAMTATAAEALLAAAADPAARLEPSPLPRPSPLDRMKGRLIRPKVAS